MNIAKIAAVAVEGPRNTVKNDVFERLHAKYIVNYRVNSGHVGLIMAYVGPMVGKLGPVCWAIYVERPSKMSIVSESEETMSMTSFLLPAGGGKPGYSHGF